MKILVTGSNGMLGNEIVKNLETKYNVYSTSRGKNIFKFKNYKNFDLNDEKYTDLENWSNPDIIIHSAAITNIDYCELNKKYSNLTNIDSIKKIYNHFKESHLIFISSDSVFDGSKSFFKEDDNTNPLNHYGLQKKIAEDFVKLNFKNYTIIRTTPIGFKKKSYNFLSWLIKSAEQKKEINLFSNVYFTPIDVWSFVDSILIVLKKNLQGTFHITGAERISKYRFGLELIKNLKLDQSLLKQILIDDSKLVAKRSKDQSLDCSKYKAAIFKELPNLHIIIKNILNNLNYDKN